MKIILSRKGFDSKNGGFPSPVLPDGKMMSLPIPIEGDWSYNGLTAPGVKNYAEIMEELCANQYIGNKGAHMDPDLVRTARDRSPGWLPAFGQNEGAQTVLDDRGVSKGDLFLFFGWFRHTKKANGKLRYCFGPGGWNDKEDFHAIFGYLEIGEKYEVNEDAQLPNWLNDHLHAMEYRRKIKGNTIYVATPKLSFHPSYPGGGVFEFDERLRRTKKGESKSCWDLPRQVFQDVTISSHPETSEKYGWKENYFRLADRGQEFVIPNDYYELAPERVIQWASDLIKGSRLWSD